MSIAFNEAYYLANNPDVAAAINAGLFQSAEEHFNLFGWSEGRDPNENFDTSFYLSENPDVAAAGVNPLDHFWAYGAAEGRIPNQTIDTLLGQPEIGGGDDAFDSATYLAANPDVQAAVDAGSFTAYQHWVLYGQFENRDGAQTLSGTDLSSIVLDTPLGSDGDPDDGDTGGSTGSGGGGGGSSPTGNTIILEAGASEVLVGGVPVNATNSATDLNDTIYSTFDNADLSVIDAGDGEDTLIITGFNTFHIDDVRTNDATELSDHLDMSLTSVENIIFEDAIGEVDIDDHHNGENYDIRGDSGALEAETTKDGQTLIVRNTSGSHKSEIILSDHSGLSVTLGASDDEIDDLQTSDAYVDAGGGDDEIWVSAEAAETATIIGGDGSEDALIIDANISVDTHYVFTNVSGIEYLDIYEDDSNLTSVDLFDGIRGIGILCDGIGTGETRVYGTADQWNNIFENFFQDTGNAKTLVLSAEGDIDFTRYDVDLSGLGSGGAGGVLLSSGNDSLTLGAENAYFVADDGGLIDGGDGTDTLIMVDTLVDPFGGNFTDLDAVRNFETIVLGGGEQEVFISDETTASGQTTAIDASELTGGLFFCGCDELDGALEVLGSNFGDFIILGAGADTATLGSGDDVVQIVEVENGTLVFGADTINGFTVGVDPSSGDAISFSRADVDFGDTTELTFSTIHGDGANTDISALIDRGSVSVLDVAAGADVDDAAEHHIINFTDTSGISFADAIGAGTVDVNDGGALAANTAVLLTYFDSDAGAAIIGYVDDLGGNDLLDATDTVNTIASVGMTAADYANFAANSLMFD